MATTLLCRKIMSIKLLFNQIIRADSVEYDNWSLIINDSRNITARKRILTQSMVLSS